MTRREKTVMRLGAAARWYSKTFDVPLERVVIVNEGPSIGNVVLESGRCGKIVCSIDMETFIFIPA